MTSVDGTLPAVAGLGDALTLCHKKSALVHYVMAQLCVRWVVVVIGKYEGQLTSAPSLLACHTSLTFHSQTLAASLIAT